MDRQRQLAHGAAMLRVLERNDVETDLTRLQDLVKHHGLRLRRVRTTYMFDDYTAHGLKQALGFAEGYDRAMQHVQNS
jgi:hypothetical protein